MKIKVLTQIGLLTFVMLAVNGNSQMVLVSEDWSSGSINSAVWNTGGSVFVVMTEGDNALCGTGGGSRSSGSHPQVAYR